MTAENTSESQEPSILPPYPPTRIYAVGEQEPVVEPVPKPVHIPSVAQHKTIKRALRAVPYRPVTLLDELEFLPDVKPKPKAELPTGRSVQNSASFAGVYGKQKPEKKERPSILRFPRVK
jgi:hypothetical protein